MRLCVRIPRPAALAALFVALLAPYSEGVLIPLEDAGSACSAKGCKCSGTCHCRHADQHRRAGPLWSAVPPCKERCGQSPAVSRVASCGPVARMAGAVPSAPKEQAPLPAAAAIHFADAEFVLFGRPPPAV